jgi:hypothetical protein
MWIMLFTVALGVAVSFSVAAVIMQPMLQRTPRGF